MGSDGRFLALVSGVLFAPAVFLDFFPGLGKGRNTPEHHRKEPSDSYDDGGELLLGIVSATAIQVAVV